MATGFSTPRIEPPKYTVESLKEIFFKAGIIFSATHGEYKKTSTKFIVPPNTIVFETSAVGNYCTTSPVGPLEELAGGERAVFWNYLTNPTVSPAGGGGGGTNKYLAALSQLIMYVPGDRLPERILTIGSHRPAGMKFGVSKIPHMGADTDMGAIQAINAHLEKDGHYTSNGQIINWISNPQTGFKPTIYIFISCAAYEPNMPSTANTIIEKIQRNARLGAAALGFTPLLGGANAPEVEENYDGITVSSPEANARMWAVGDLPIREKPKCVDGYAILVSVGNNRFLPLHKNERFCLTKEEVEEAKQLAQRRTIPRIFQITQYNKGELIGGTMFGEPSTGRMEGGRRTRRIRKRRGTRRSRRPYRS